MQPLDFDDVLDQLVAKDSRYDRESYVFIREALDYTQRWISKGDPKRMRHVSGQELLDGIRQLALANFGPMVVTVFEEWGVRHCGDFGEIVFNMVEAKLLATTEKDSREDFAGRYDFNDAFRKPFLPSRKTAASETDVLKT